MRKLFLLFPVLFIALIVPVTVGADSDFYLVQETEELPVIVIETETDPVLTDSEPVVEETKEQEEIPVVSELEQLLQDEDFLTLCATMHFEAGVANTFEAKFCVGKVVINRLNDTEKWGYETIQDVVYAPKQFSVAHKACFESFKDELRAGIFDENSLCTVTAAYFVYSGIDAFDVEPDVQFFNMDQGLSSWGGHRFAFECGGNAFYYK